MALGTLGLLAIFWQAMCFDLFSVLNTLRKQLGHAKSIVYMALVAHFEIPVLHAFYRDPETLADRIKTPGLIT